MQQIIIDGVEYILTLKLQTEKPEVVYNDWRLPTIEELATLIDYTRYEPASFLKDTVSGYYWSATTYAGSTDSVWVVYFGNGNQYGNGNKTNGNYVRCVRDSEHGLQWTKSYEKMTWYEDIEFAKTLIAPAYHSLQE